MSEWTIAGKTVIVTGANTGIGRVTAVQLARQGARVWLACRSEERTRAVLDEIAALAPAQPARFVHLDLGDFANVRQAAETFLASGEPLHVLVNNAGLAGQKGLTTDGFERTFGVNHLGPFLFTLLLMPRLKESAPARIVNVASNAHSRIKALDLAKVQAPTATTTGFPEYCNSKLANVLFTVELARRLQGSGVTTYSLHPGAIASDIWRKLPWPLRPLFTLFMRTTTQGAQSSIHCATAADVADESGRYYSSGRKPDSCRPTKMNPVAEEPALAEELWRRSLEWTGAPDLTATSG